MPGLVGGAACDDFVDQHPFFDRQLQGLASSGVMLPPLIPR